VLLLKGGEHPGEMLVRLCWYFPGFKMSFLGSVIGAFWAFVYGFAGGEVISRVYNLVAGKRRA
jgi:hypothetical protein